MASHRRGCREIGTRGGRIEDRHRLVVPTRLLPLGAGAFDVRGQPIVGLAERGREKSGGAEGEGVFAEGDLGHHRPVHRLGQGGAEPDVLQPLVVDVEHAGRIDRFHHDRGALEQIHIPPGQARSQIDLALLQSGEEGGGPSGLRVDGVEPDLDRLDFRRGARVGVSHQADHVLVGWPHHVSARAQECAAASTVEHSAHGEEQIESRVRREQSEMHAPVTERGRGPAGEDRVLPEGAHDVLGRHRCPVAETRVGPHRGREVQSAAARFLDQLLLEEGGYRVARRRSQERRFEDLAGEKDGGRLGHGSRIDRTDRINDADAKNGEARGHDRF